MDLQLYSVAATPVIIGLVEVAKRTGMTGRYAPLLSVLLGLALAALLKLSEPALGSWFALELAGIISGLLACGLYSGQKALRE